MYRITTDRAKAIIEVKVGGFWSVDQVEAFRRDFATHVARIALTGRRQAVLYDFTDAPIQSQAVVGVLQDMGRADHFKSRRVALYSGGSDGGPAGASRCRHKRAVRGVRRSVGGAGVARRRITRQ